MKIRVQIECPFCGNLHSVSVDADGFNAWADGAPIQDALPNLSVTEREQIISCLCPDCQKDIFG